MKRFNLILLSIIVSISGVIAQEYEGCDFQRESNGFKWYRTYNYINGRLCYGILDENRSLILTPQAKFISALYWDENTVFQLDLHSGHKIFMMPGCEQIVSGYIDNCNMNPVYDDQLNKIANSFYLSVEHRGKKYAISKDYQILATINYGNIGQVQYLHEVGSYYTQVYHNGSYGAYVDGKEIFPMSYKYTSCRRLELNGEVMYYITGEDKNGTDFYKSLTGETIPNPYSYKEQAFATLKKCQQQRGEALLAGCDYLLTFKKSHNKNLGGKLGICNDGTVIINIGNMYKKTNLRVSLLEDYILVLSINNKNILRLIYSENKRTGKTELTVTGRFGAHTNDIIVFTDCTSIQTAKKLKTALSQTTSYPEIRLL